MADQSPRLTSQNNLMTPDRADPAPVSDLTFLRVKSNDILQQEEELKKQEQRLANDQSIEDALSTFVRARWQEAKDAKKDIENEIIDSRQRRAGTYSAARLAEIQEQGGSDIFMKITEVKCNECEAWISDVIIPAEGKGWKLTPTPKPELPQPIVDQIITETVAEFERRGIENTQEQDIRDFVNQMRDIAMDKIRKEAKRRADRMELLIDDELTEGNFEEAMDEGISDLACDGTMIIKGPYIELIKKMEWLDDDFQPDVTEVPMMMFKRVDPLKFWISPGGTGTQPRKSTYCIEYDEFTRKSLHAMVGVRGYDSAKITKLITDNPNGVTLNLDTKSDTATLEGRQGIGRNDNPDNKYQGLWYVGAIPGYLLHQWGLRVPDITQDYEAISLDIGGQIIMARLNSNPLGERNYHSAVYKPRKGSFWGYGVPQLMKSEQDTCNATARHLINNLAIASGPQVAIHDVSALAEGESIDSLFPWRIWQFGDKTGRTPISFYQPNLNADQLMAVYKMYLAQADETTGIPKLQPTEMGPATKMPATSLTILMNTSSRVLKKSIMGIDNKVARPIVTQAFTWNMIFVDDPSIKGDVAIEASGAIGMFVKEQQQLRLNEYIGLTSNANDLRLIGDKRRAALLRAAATGLPLETEDVAPSEQEMEMQEREAQAQAQNQQAQQMQTMTQQGQVVTQ